MAVAPVIAGSRSGLRSAVSAGLLLIAAGMNAGAPAKKPAPPKTPRNIIFLIGDGMGPPHVTYARILRGNDFQLRKMTLAALLSTTCADRTVTDSGAGATAFATGFKVNYEAVSLDAAGKPLRTVLEAAEGVGKATGLVTTAAFWDATPAAFAAHAAHRNQHLEIIRQMLRSGVEILAGNGAQRFGRDSFPTLEELARESGYTLLRTRAEVEAAKGERLFAVFPARPREMDAEEMSLSDLARVAIDRLSRDRDGFFLMIEHEGVDSASHVNFREDLANSLRSFDAAVGVALDFAMKRDDTLVLVTGDHETGGMRVTETPSRRPRVEFSTVDHTATDVPLFVYGPGSGTFHGFLDNTDVGKALLAMIDVRNGR
ncbi:MAG TPA: alkaline phosphatase [Thermoanaerobaculia bacterium]|nr:alkaline phosphatase [Thermoanaerobaculia bacterium]